MATWSNDELDTIGQAHELQIAPRRGDCSLSNPVTIWVVRVGDNLYIRSWRGRNGSWFRGAVETHKGHIRAGGIEKDTTFVEETEPGINDQIDAAYREKYRSYAATYVPPMIAPQARATTLKLVAHTPSS